MESVVGQDLAGLPLSLASWHVGPVQFDRPVWLVLIPILGVITVVIATVNLSGLGAATRWTALAVRLLVVTLLAGALAEPQWRKEAKKVAVTVVLDSSQSVPAEMQKQVERYVKEAGQDADERRDLLGLVTAARDSFVQFLPSHLNRGIERQTVGKVDGTNLAQALSLALAVNPTDAAYRILLASDGNQTSGNILAAAESAKAIGVPVDVLPIRYQYKDEVIVDRVVTPGSAREGEPLTVRVVLNATRDTRGKLSVLMNGEPVDLNGGDPGVSQEVELRAGANVKTIQVPALVRGPVKFDGFFEPYSQGGVSIGDALAENNRGSGITFVAGEARVLVIADDASTQGPLVRALSESGIKADVRTHEQAPAGLVDFNAYDCIVMMNQEAGGYSQKQQEDLRQYVHDTGGGLVMIGGDRSFGAGGWIGSPLEDALPVKLDPPQKRQMPKGALVVTTHSIEMPEGVFWGKKTAEAAVNALSRLDLIGINEFDGFGPGGGSSWVHELQPVGDGTKVKRAIQNLAFGDMPDFTPCVQMAYDALSKADVGQRHLIIISDGDPSPPPTSLLDKFVAAKITISTVEVFPHSAADSSRMKWMAEYTKGRWYFVDTQAALATIPQIFVKEAQTVRRSLIQEVPQGFTPSVMSGVSETLRGVKTVPPMTGYVVTAEREGLALTTMKGKEGDPILAQWQHGLGKVVAYTSDASARWNPAWISWPGYKAFWEQHVRWAMRPTGSANVRASAENRGEDTIITVEALDSAGERLNFARFQGRVANPDGTGTGVELKQIGPGRYQGSVPTAQAGSFIASLRYVAPDPKVSNGTLEGTVQVAINRPFADEYRTLQDNAGLLEQVAQATGGRVLTGDPKKDRLWDEKGLKFPVATTSIWLAVALTGLGLFLVDVAVRRVRIDVRAMARSVAGLFGKSTSQEARQIGALKAAKDVARKRMAEREAAALERGAVKDVAKAAAAVAKTKFEARPDQLKSGASAVALGGADAKPEAIKPKARPVDAPSAEQQAEGMSRLMQAKKKARDEMSE